jgi:hypothetical protein
VTGARAPDAGRLQSSSGALPSVAIATSSLPTSWSIQVSRLLDGISREVDEAAARRRDRVHAGLASPEQLEARRRHGIRHIPAGQTARADRRRADVALAARNLAAAARATDSRAEERYAAATAMRADLIRVLNGYAASAAWTLLDRTSFFLRRNARPVGIVAGALLLVAALAAYYTRQVYIEHERTLHEMRRAQVVDEVLANVFRTAAPTLEMAGLMSAADILDRGTASALRRLADAPQQRAIAVEAMASTYLDLRGRAKAQELLDTAIADLESQPGLAIERARLHILRGRAAVAPPERAEVDIDAATRLLASVRGYAIDEANLEALRIAVLAQRPGARGEAEHRREALMALMQGEDLADTSTFAGLLIDRAQERAFGNDYAGVKADMAQALAIARARFGPASPQALQTERAMVFYSVASTRRRRRTDRVLAAQHQTVAQSFGEKSLEFSDVLVFEASSPANATTCIGAQVFRAIAGDCARASRARCRTSGARKSQSRRCGNRHRQSGPRLELYKDALRIRLLHNASRDDEPTTINRLQIARAECELGRYASANAGFTDARKQLAGRLAPTHAYLAVAASLQVDCLLRQHDTAAARALFHAEMTRRGRLSRRRDRATTDTRSCWPKTGPLLSDDRLTTDRLHRKRTRAAIPS